MNSSTKPRTTYYSRGIGNHLPKAIFILVTILMLWAGAAQAATYYWRGGATRNADKWSEPLNWSTSASGTPTGRNTPSSDDIIIFDGSITGLVFPNPIIVDFPSNTTLQTIAQLKIVNAAKVYLSGPTSGTNGSALSIAGGAAASPAANDFFVENGSSLTLNAGPTSGNNFLVINISNGRKGLVNGEITMNANNTSRLVATGTGTLVFAKPLFLSNVSPTFTVSALIGSPFGTTGASTISQNGISDVAGARSVVFTEGTSFIQQAGGNPFGAGPDPVTAFDKLSQYTYSGGSFSTAGQAYGNLTLQGPNVTISGASGLNTNFFSAYNLTIASGVFSLAPSATLTATITGNLSVAKNAGLTLGGNVNDLNLSGDFIIDGTLITQSIRTNFNFVGSSAQALKSSVSTGGNSNPTTKFGSDVYFTINNPAGLTLLQETTVEGLLQLTNGVIHTSRTSGLLRLGAAAQVQLPTTPIISYVDGPLGRFTPAITSSSGGRSFMFPIGKNGQARPLTLNIANQTTTDQTILYIAEQQDYPNSSASIQPPTPPALSSYTASSPLHHVSFIRYFTITPTTTPGNFSGTVTLSFGKDDYVTNPSLETFVVAKSTVATPSSWANIGRAATNPVSSAIVSGSPYYEGNLTSSLAASSSTPLFTPFQANTNSNFTLATTQPSLGYPGQNPLPVELTRFSAAAKSNGINLDWATASEKNNDRFEVQRSATGQEFVTLGTIKGQGNSSNAHEYAFLDSQPSTGLTYYRLRQVDSNGTVTYSPVATAQWKGENLMAAFPNPTTGIVTLPAAAGAVHYRVLNLVGKTMLSGQANGNERIDLSQLKQGTFFLEMTGAAGRSTQRLVRE